MTKNRRTHTSAKVKNRYNEKSYDRLVTVVYKGEKEKVKQRADAVGLSVSAYINMLIEKDIADFNAMK